MDSAGGQDERPAGRSHGRPPRRPLPPESSRFRQSGYPGNEDPALPDRPGGDDAYPDDRFAGEIPANPPREDLPGRGPGRESRAGGGRHAGGRHGGGHSGGQPPLAGPRPGGQPPLAGPRPGGSGPRTRSEAGFPADDRDGYGSAGLGARRPGSRLRPGGDPPAGSSPRPRGALPSAARPRPEGALPPRGRGSRPDGVPPPVGSLPAGSGVGPGGERRPAAPGQALRAGSPGGADGARPPARGLPDPATAHPDRRSGRGDGGPGRGSPGPIRGYPPLPGQPDPAYPPGQFSLWNRPSVRTAWLGLAPSEDPSRDGDADPGYAHLAVSEPSADATSTQTWSAIDDIRGWPSVRSGGRAAAQSDHGTYPGTRDQSARSIGDALEPVRGQRAGSASSSAQPGLSGGLPGWGAGSTRGGGAGAPSGALDDSEDLPMAAAPRTRADGRRKSSASAGRAVKPAAPRGATERGRRPPTAGRSNRLLAILLATPVAAVIVVVGVYVFLNSGSTTTGHVASPATTASSPSPTLGPWKHIDTRADDPLPLSLGELFPARFAATGAAGSMTVDRADTRCTRAVIGGALQSAVRKAGCTQAMRASYLSTDRKMMATIGVLNLVSATEAKKVGEASGAAEFVSQLPGPRGPTKNLAKGTGLEQAQVKGHYLILIWAEFANLSPPSGKRQRAKLEQFSAGLIDGTVNATLSSRMVTGQPVGTS